MNINKEKLQNEIINEIKNEKDRKKVLLKMIYLI